jgi:very-short-patch-repair endonuclease
VGAIAPRDPGPGANPDAIALIRPMGGKVQGGELQRRIRRLADEQYGIVSRSQLSELGLGPDAIDHRLKLGHLHRIYRGVYSTVGLRLLSRNGRWMAAILFCGPGAVLSYRAAAALWGIRGGAPIEITAPRALHRRRGIRLHWADLPDDEVTAHQGIPTTTVPRTLLDLSAVVGRDEWRGALRQAEQLRLTDRLCLGDLTERYPRKPGIPIVRAVVEEARHGMAIVRSELEERFQAFVLHAGLPRPSTNVLIEGIEVDCAWEAQRLVVELDGRATHDTTDAFEIDRARDRRLEAAGWRVVRVTWRQLHDSPRELEQDLWRLLGLGDAA